LSQHDREVYERLNDPSNEVMNTIRYGGDKGIKDVYKQDLWNSIKLKKKAVD
jgi:hypothetical protein